MRITRLVKTIVSTMLCIFVLTCTLASSVKAGELSETGLGESDEATSSDSNSTTNSDNNGIFENDGYTVTFTLVSDWSSGYQLSVTIDNTGNTDIRNWYLAFDYCGDITNIWNAEVYERNGNLYTVKNVGWNMDIPAGESISFGISENTCFPGYPSNVSVMCGNASAEQDDYSIEYSVENEWNEGFVGNFCITNNSDAVFEDWSLEFDFDREISSFWNAVLDSHEGNHYVIRHSDDNAYIAPSQTITFGFICPGSASVEPSNINLIKSDLLSEEILDPVLDPEADSDGDGLTDELETAIGTNPEKEDTDDDGLTDYQEIYLTWTDPTLYDTDENGVCDADEDLDGDGLANLEELTRGTDLGNPDSDRDDLGDYDEIFVYGTDPLNPDSDGDTLTDGDDVLLGFSPLLPDTDGNGILDCDEKQYQTTENDFPLGDGRGITNVSVSMNISGNIDKEVGVLNIYDFDVQSRDVVGIIGVPMEIRSDVSFDTATIKFSYDETMLGDTAEEDLSLMWYDEANNWYQILDQDSVVDTINNTVSYTTTHFSKYMVVDRQKWHKTWKNASSNSSIIVPELSESEIVYKPADYFLFKNVSFSFSDYKPYDERVIKLEQALRDAAKYSSGSVEGDFIFKSGIGGHYWGNGVVFDSLKEYYTELEYELTQNGEHLWASSPFKYFTFEEAIDSILYTVEKHPERFSDTQKAIVLIVDGYFKITDTQLQRCENDGIKIYIIDLSDNVMTGQIDYYTGKSGIRYFSGITVDYPLGLMNIITKDLNGIIDFSNITDSDEDGISDYYETNGMLCSNGRILYSTVGTKHSDNDGLIDGDEVEEKVKENAYIGLNTYLTAHYFIEHSNPMKDDTDEDGFTDDVDPNPMFATFLGKSLSNGYSFQYLRIDGLDGGNQGWWAEGLLGYNDKFNPAYFVASLDYRMAKKGCGVVAASDCELYIAQQNGYTLLSPYDVHLDSSTGEIDKNEYMDYVKYNSISKYPLSADLKGMAINAAPWEMENWISRFLYFNGHPYYGVKWAPYYDGENTMKVIEEMISNNLPVVISFDNHFNEVESLNIYYDNPNETDNQMRAIKGNLNINLGDQPVSSHYMTVIGYIKYYDEDGLGFDYLLKVVSWGGIYYIRYSDYVKGLSISSNILRIY